MTVDLIPPNWSFEDPIAGEWVPTAPGVAIERVGDPEVPDGAKVLQITTALPGWEGFGGVRSASFPVELDESKKVRLIGVLRVHENRSFYPAVSERDAEDKSVAFHEYKDEEGNLIAVPGETGTWQLFEWEVQFTTGTQARVHWRLDGPSEVPDEPIFFLDAKGVWPIPKPALRFEDDFETGDLSRWTEAQNIDGGLCTIESANPIRGGRSGRFELPAGTRRAEVMRRSSKTTFEEGEHVFVQFLSRFEGDAASIGTFMQLKQDHETGSAPVELGIHEDSGRVVMAGGPSEGITHQFHWWGPPAQSLVGQVHEYIVHAFLANDPEVGYVELWFDRVKQRLTAPGETHTNGVNDGDLRKFWSTFTSVPGDLIYLKVGAYNDFLADGDCAHIVDMYRASTDMPEFLLEPPLIPSRPTRRRGLVVPKLAVPIRQAGGSLAAVEQDSPDEVAACVYALVATERGSRLEAPDYGVEDPAFERIPVEAVDAEWLEQIGIYEPRAEVETAQEVTDLTDRITLKVDAR